MSGYTGDDVVQRGLLDPGAPFQQKPFTPGTLATKVRSMLDQRPRTRIRQVSTKARHAECDFASLSAGRNSRCSARRVTNPRGVASRASRSPAMFTIRWVTPGKIGTT